MKKARRRNPRHEYEVIVGNIGSVYSGGNKTAALKKFKTYIEQSKSGYGRAGQEDVVLMMDGDIHKEYLGSLHEDDVLESLIESKSTSEENPRLPSGLAILNKLAGSKPISVQLQKVKGKIQLKVPRPSPALMKRLGLRARMQNPVEAKPYWMYPFSVIVRGSQSGNQVEGLSFGGDSLAQAKKFVSAMRARGLLYGRFVEIIHNTGTNKPGGVKTVFSKAY